MTSTDNQSQPLSVPGKTPVHCFLKSPELAAGQIENADLCPHCAVVRGFSNGEQPDSALSDPDYWDTASPDECAHWLLLAPTLKEDLGHVPEFLDRLIDEANSYERAGGKLRRWRNRPYRG